MLTAPSRQAVRQVLSAPRAAAEVRPSKGQTRGWQCSLVWLVSLPPAQSEASGETKWLDKNKGMLAWPGMGRNPPRIQPVWSETYPPW